MSSEVRVVESSGVDPSIQLLTLVNSAGGGNVGTNDPPTVNPTNNDLSGGSAPPVGRDIKNVCLVCLQPLENQSPSSKGPCPEGLHGGMESVSNLGRECSSSEHKLTLTLLDFCQLLKVNVPPGITRHALWTFSTPLCEKCVEDVRRIRALHRQIVELELSLAEARNSVKDKVVAHNIKNDICDTNGEEGVNPLTGIVCAVKKIRSYIKKDVSESVSKKRGRKQGKKGRHTTLEDAEMTPTVLKEVASRKSSFGRVVKRPRYFIMSDDENGDADDVEKKFDPNVAVPQPSVPSDKGGSVIGVVKVEALGSSGKQRVDFSEGAVVESKSEGGETKMRHGSEVEFQGHTSDGNWSDGIEQVFEDDDGDTSSKNIAKRSRLKKITKRKNLLASSASSILNKRKKAVGNLKKGKLTGVTGEAGMGGSKNSNEMSNAIENVKVETKTENDESLKVKCDKCPRTFSDVIRKERHMKKIHQGIKRIYECKGCDKKFSKMKELSHHRKVEHPPKDPKVDASGRKLFQCDICKAVFKNFADLQIHHRLHTGEKPFKCSIEGCKEAFISKGRYEVHVEVKHPGKAPLKCEFCPRSFFRHHRLRDHKKSHTGEKPYLCEICSKAFTQPAYLKYHQTKHKELNLAEFKCDQCDKKFASPINLKYHRETQHQKKYRYHCDICGHGATHKSHMRLHMRRHTGERPHTCPLCQKTFTRGAQLKIHIRSHTGERPYSCTLCTKGFTNSSKLRRHELTHSENKSKRRQNIVKVTQLSSADQQTHFPQSSSTLSAAGLAGTSNGILLPADMVDVQVDEDNNGQAVLKLEHVPTSLNEQDFQQQLITIQQPNGVTYQIIASDDAINNETFAEYILINGDFTLG